MEISAQSVGGGEVQVTKINDIDVNINAKSDTIIITLCDKPGAISQITDIIQKNNINIASLNCNRKTKGQNATCLISVDGVINQAVIEEIKQKTNPAFIRYVKKLFQ